MTIRMTNELDFLSTLSFFIDGYYQTLSEVFPKDTHILEKEWEEATLKLRLKYSELLGTSPKGVLH